MNLTHAVQATLDAVPNPNAGLPPEVFSLVSQLTPLVNVDLLLRKDPSQESSPFLLTWRDDEYYQGWHIPGGIVRFKESWQSRMDAVALIELGTEIAPGATLLGVFEMMAPTRRVRGHFISMLFQCQLLTPLDPTRRCGSLNSPRPGEWSWFDVPPSNLLAQQHVYHPLLKG